MNRKLWLVMALAASPVYAQDFATVVNRQPRYVQVMQQQCQTIQESVSINTNEGKVVGGVAGAALGSTLGSNHRDHLAGAVIGGLVGAAIGNQVSRGPSEIQQRTVCRNIPVNIQQGEIVTFEYRGRYFTQQFGN